MRLCQVCSTKPAHLVRVRSGHRAFDAPRDCLAPRCATSNGAHARGVVVGDPSLLDSSVVVEQRVRRALVAVHRDSDASWRH
jgi:hypothetical protein